MLHVVSCFIGFLKHCASLKCSKTKPSTSFVLLFQWINKIGRLMKKLICIGQSRFGTCYAREISKMFSVTSKYFCLFKNTTPSSWVAHITRNFLTCYSYSYYGSFIVSWCKQKNFLIAVIVLTRSVFKTLLNIGDGTFCRLLVNGI